MAHKFFGPALGALGKGVTTAIGITQANKQRNWQRENLQNAVQWRVADLKAAGINPILAANMGLGTGGSPGGAMPQIPDFGQVGDQVTNATNVESQGKLRKGQKKLTDMQYQREVAQIGLIEAQKQKTLAETINLGQTKDIKGPQSDMAHWAREWFTRTARSNAKDRRPASIYELYRLLDEEGVLQGNWEQSKEDIKLLWKLMKKNSIYPYRENN